MKTADFVIIGSGQGGVPLAAKLAEKDRRVVIFERAAWGGTCVNTGCIPSKTLLASAHAAAAARNAASLGVYADVKVSFGEVMSRVRDSIQPEGITEWLNSVGVELIEAEAELIGPHTVKGGDTTVEAETIVINTGKAPNIPAIPGLAGTPYLTYQNFKAVRIARHSRQIPGRLQRQRLLRSAVEWC
jgi:dihydrolipoamide dehydrogenase